MALEAIRPNFGREEIDIEALDNRVRSAMSSYVGLTIEPNGRVNLYFSVTDKADRDSKADQVLERVTTYVELVKTAREARGEPLPPPSPDERPRIKPLPTPNDPRGR